MTSRKIEHQKPPLAIEQPPPVPSVRRISPKGPEPKLPFFRQSMTFGMWEDCPITIEIIVLSEHPLDDDTDGPGREDIPALQEGGWISHSHPEGHVYIRTLS